MVSLWHSMRPTRATLHESIVGSHAYSLCLSFHSRIGKKNNDCGLSYGMHSGSGDKGGSKVLVIARPSVTNWLRRGGRERVLKSRKLRLHCYIRILGEVQCLPKGLASHPLFLCLCPRFLAAGKVQKICLPKSPASRLEVSAPNKAAKLRYDVLKCSRKMKDAASNPLPVQILRSRLGVMCVLVEPELRRPRDASVSQL